MRSKQYVCECTFLHTAQDLLSGFKLSYDLLLFLSLCGQIMQL